MLGQKTPLWESTPYPDDGKHFVIADGDVLVSHALAHQKKIEHAGETWDVGALSSVFTYPTHRGGGFGEQIVAAATDDLRGRNVDFALLFCGNRVKSLYQRTGWEHRPNLRVTFGEPKEPKRFYDVHPESYVMSLIVSDTPSVVVTWSVP